MKEKFKRFAYTKLDGMNMRPTGRNDR